MQISLLDLKNLSKDFSILYVEDIEDIRVQLVSILKELFREVYVAKDGREALEIFINHKVDIVITDIEMPYIDGIALTKELKSERDIPVIITTAYSDSNYFLRLIEIGVDGYILKPITQKQLMDSIYRVVKAIVNKRALDEFRAKEIQDKINYEAKLAIENVVNGSPNLIIVLDANENITFFNTAFKNRFSIETLKKIEDRVIKFEDILEKREGFLSNLCEYKDLAKVSIRTKHGRKIFKIHKAKIDNEHIMYELDDVTTMEYQRIKIQNYNHVLESLIFKKLKKRDIEKLEREKVIAEIELVDVVKAPEMINAKDYYESVKDLLGEFDELEKLEKEIINVIEKLEDKRNFEEFIKLSKKLNRYASIMATLIEFKEVIFSLSSFTAFITSLNREDFEIDGIFDKLLNISKFLVAKLIEWRERIFKKQDVDDIHYLDNQLINTIMQAQLLFVDFHSKD